MSPVRYLLTGYGPRPLEASDNNFCLISSSTVFLFSYPPFSRFLLCFRVAPVASAHTRRSRVSPRLHQVSLRSGHFSFHYPTTIPNHSILILIFLCSSHTNCCPVPLRTLPVRRFHRLPRIPLVTRPPTLSSLPYTAFQLPSPPRCLPLAPTLTSSMPPTTLPGQARCRHGSRPLACGDWSRVNS